MRRDYWPTNGTKHHDISKSGLYINAEISGYLDTDSQTLLIAAKGMGKTLLLRAKKKIVEDNSEGIEIIPRHREYDTPKFTGTFPKRGLDNVSFWKDLWKSSIIFSILSHTWNKEDFKEEQLFNHIEELDIDDKFIYNLIDDIYESNSNLPSYYLMELLRKGNKTVQQFLKTAYKVEALSDKFINHSVVVFIDAFDQTLTEHFAHSLSTWRCAQLGLAKSVNDLNTHNRHIKVYATIRQEAYAGFVDDDREVIKGISLLLEYSKNELRAMLEHAIKKYTKYNTISDFCRLSKLHNGWCGQEEDIFDYIYRHSTATPRSIIYLGKVISDKQLNLKDTDEAEDTIRRLVNEAGTNNLYRDYLLGQKRIFLKTLNSEERIKKILGLIPSNVLTGKALFSINKRFSEIIGVDQYRCHPFCELFNIGLLGTIRRSASTNNIQQYFRKSYEFNWIQNEIVKNDNIYLMHPSLHSAITEDKLDYYLNSSNIIGDERPWVSPEDKKIFPLIFISHSSSDKEYVDKMLPIFEDTVNQIIPSTFWYDKWSIRAGGNIHQEIEKGVAGSDFVIVCISSESLNSGWVEKEWRTKHYDEITSKRIQVIAIIIDGTEPSNLPGFLKTKKAITLPPYGDDNYSVVFHGICRDILHYLIEANSCK